MAYTIRKYTYDKARKLGVRVRPSHNRTKKIDVLNRQGKVVASVGAAGMNDYPTYMVKRGTRYANGRRKLYKQRHEKDRHQRGTPGFYADRLLW